MQYDVTLDCWITLYDLPPHVDALVRESSDGTIMMLINSALDAMGRRRAYEHERKHILRGDLHSDKDAKTIEEEIT